MSDIGILNSPLALVMLALIIASPGLAIGAVTGALTWRRHRIAGLLLGAAIDGALCFAGWAWFSGNL